MVDSTAERNSSTDHVIVTIVAEEQEDANEQREDDGEPARMHVPVRHMSIDEHSPLMGSLQHQRQKPAKSSCLRFWKMYQSWLESRPMLTKCVTAAILVGCGDLAGETIELWTHAASSLNLWRILSFTLMGLLLQAPITHYYYLVLDAKLPPTLSPWTSTTFIKLAIDQLVFAPCFTALVFLFLGFCEGDSVSQILDHMQRDYWTTMVANWKLWVPAVFVNLAFCPPELRVLYCNLVFFVWSICLSLLLNAQPSTADHDV